MADDAYKTAEQRGYAKGYAAGKRRRTRDAAEERRINEREQFRRRAFLAALPFAMGANGWKRGEKPINSLEDRVSLARDIADESVNQFFIF